MLPSLNHVDSGQTHAFKSPTTRPQWEINDDGLEACFYSRASTAGTLTRILADGQKSSSLRSLPNGKLRLYCNNRLSP